MMIIFWDMEVPICIHFISNGGTMNSQNYCELLRPMNAKSGLKGVILLQDNAQHYLVI